MVSLGPSGKATSRALWWQLVPVRIRIVFYATSFLAGILVGLPYLAYQVDVHLPALHAEIGWGRLLGGIVLAAFLGTYLYCSYHLTHRGQGAYVEFDPPSRFVADGPYRMVRNPVAGCVLGMLLGEAIALSSTGVLALFLLAAPLAHLQVMLLEEPLLRKRFGDVYEQYCRCVPRWIPRLQGPRTAGG
jgi:protein-S-isoprenylcysteine O-methyltransferase Ste14